MGFVDQGTQALPNLSSSYNRFRITVVRGVDAGTSFESEADECSIGTSPGNQLVVTDPLVSRHHCVIRASSDGTMLLDLGSTNGTSLGGLRIEAAFLTSGLSFEVGGTTLRFESLEERVTPPLSASNQVGGLLGESAAMRRIFAIVERVAETRFPILLEGEMGVGKSALAELIHETSGRGEAPLVVVDLTSMATDAMNSALFGDDDDPGALEQARGGTLLLEEIGQLPAALQALLLASLDDELDVRIVATSQIDLREAVNSQRFRADLFYALSAIKIRVPPLRQRREDIPPLIERFYRAASVDELDPAPPAELIERLFWRPWPGNVRELRAAVERAVLIDDPALFKELDDAPSAGAFEFNANQSYRESKEAIVARFERWYVDELIRRHGGNLSRAARAARMDRSYLRELAKRHGVTLPSTTRGK